jgi:methionyl-tRNA formyltransferase
MNVVLLGKGDLSIKVAEYCKLNFNLSLVIPDKPEPTWTGSLQNWCIKNNVPYIESGNFKDLDKTQKFDLGISIFYGKIIKKEFISRCEKIINLHNAPLPKYRGVRPINWALKNNEKYHGITIHEITEGIDDGPIIGKLTYPTYPEIEEVEDVYRKSLDYGWLLFKDVISKIEYAYNNSSPQKDLESSYYSNKEIKNLGDRSNFKR